MYEGRVNKVVRRSRVNKGWHRAFPELGDADIHHERVVARYGTEVGARSTSGAIRQGARFFRIA